MNDAVSGLKTEQEKAALKLILDEWRSGKQSILVNEVADVEWDEIPLPVDEWLMNEDMVGETGHDMYPQLREDLRELFEGGYSEAVLCVHPDTRVPLLDGTTPTIKELAERWVRNQTPVWVYSYVNGEIAPAEAIQPRQTGVDDYFRVTLDDGSTFVGNARHQMLRRDGRKVMIRDMQPGDSLMPFDVKLSEKADLCETVGNHYVVSVEKIGHGPVYCLSVPGAGNFAISTGKEVSPTRSGVFSSNTGAIGWG